MRKFNFENSEDFKKLRESIISEMNARYEKLVLTETLNSLDTAPFFKTKHIFAHKNLFFLEQLYQYHQEQQVPQKSVYDL